MIGDVNALSCEARRGGYLQSLVFGEQGLQGWSDGLRFAGVDFDGLDGHFGLLQLIQEGLLAWRQQQQTPPSCRKNAPSATT